MNILTIFFHTIALLGCSPWGAYIISENIGIHDNLLGFKKSTNVYNLYDYVQLSHIPCISLAKTNLSFDI